MSNSNALKGMACPSCGAEEPFDIQVTVMVTVHDSGTELSKYSQTAWDDDDYSMCHACGWEGVYSNLFVVNSSDEPSERKDHGLSQ